MFFFAGLSRSILQIKSQRQLEIKLNSAALMPSLEHIHQFHINFRSIKSSVSFVHPVLPSKFVQSLFQLSFSLLPFRKFTKVFFRSCRQLKRIFEPKERINVIQQIKNPKNLFHDLVMPAKNMRIILLESSDSG